jgi:hypothetical protein
VELMTGNQIDHGSVSYGSAASWCQRFKPGRRPAGILRAGQDGGVEAVTTPARHWWTSAASWYTSTDETSPV